MNPSGRCASGFGVPSPGQSTATSASAVHAVASTPTDQAPATPPGTRNGRGTSACDRRRRTRAGKTARLASASSAIERTSTTLKYFSLSLPPTANAAQAVRMAAAPAPTVARTGVPVRSEIRARNRGPTPSSEAAAWARLDPAIQVMPLTSSTSTKAEPTAAPTASAALPYTVKTLEIASMNPVNPEISSAGMTSTIASTGTQYRANVSAPARPIAAGTSRCGSRISSPAAEGSSKPRKL